MRIPKLGGTAKAVTNLQGDLVSRIDVDGDTIVGSVDKEICAVPKVGGRPRKLASSNDWISSFTLDSSKVYWLGSLSPRRIMSVLQSVRRSRSRSRRTNTLGLLRARIR